LELKLGIEPLSHLISLVIVQFFLS
jgi:hypothetical protein